LNTFELCKCSHGVRNVHEKSVTMDSIKVVIRERELQHIRDLELSV
jgi:hypothetical protein